MCLRLTGGACGLLGSFGASSCSRTRATSIHSWPSSRAWPSGGVSAVHASWSELFKAGYTSVKAHGVDDVEECSATKEMRTEGLLCSVGNFACASGHIGHQSEMSRFLVSLLRHTLSSEDVKACESLVATFVKDVDDVSCECSPHVRSGDGPVSCESGKTVPDAIEHSEKTAVVLWQSWCWLRAQVTSLSRRVGDGVCEMCSSRVDNIKALDLTAPFSTEDARH